MADQTPTSSSRLVLIIAVVIGLPLAAALIGGALTGDRVTKPSAPAEAPEAVAERLRPVGQYVLAAIDPDAVSSGSGIDGAKVYNGLCAGCHAIGAAGAPKTGEKGDWGDRVAQGKDTLYKHAINGFQGSKGMMPARGGNPNLSDDEVKAAVDHMLKAL